MSDAATRRSATLGNGEGQPLTPKALHNWRAGPQGGRALPAGRIQGEGRRLQPIGVLSIAAGKLDSNSHLVVGDMRVLDSVETESCAAALNFFALHHLDAEGAMQALAEWYRVLAPGGQLVVAIWEGTGTIDYGDESDTVALMYSSTELESWAKAAGFEINSCKVEPVDDFPMDAVYLEASKLATQQ